MKKTVLFIFTLAVAGFVYLSIPGVPVSSASGFKVPESLFDPARVPSAPDYSIRDNWAAHPDGNAGKDVDVFFVHPTSYFGNGNWNRSMEDESDDQGVMDSVERQAGVFAANCNIYAPFYRQASIYVLNAGEEDRNKALEVAYEDIENAFDHYLEHFNNGKPFILAGHSQGSNLLLWLLERRFNRPELMHKLVSAYIIGWSVTKDDLQKYPHLELSGSYDQTGCIISYNTQGKDPEISIVRERAISVNPLLWNTSGEKAPKELNEGAVFISEGGIQEIPNYTGARNVDGALVVPTPSNINELRTAYRGFYHGYDYAFFYRNLEKNVEDRIRAYKKENSPDQSDDDK
jgi:hypothetical protein